MAPIPRPRPLLAWLALALVVAAAAPSRAGEPVPADVDALLQSYRAAWESRNPFQLIDLTPKGSSVFTPLLASERFEKVARTVVELSDVEVFTREGDAARVVRFRKVQEDLFEVGTVTRGDGRFEITAVPGDEGRLLISSHVDLELGDGGRELEGPYLSTNPATWGDGRPPGERQFYLAYQKMLGGQFDEARDMLIRLLALPQEMSRLDDVRYLVGNQYFFAQIHYFLGLASERTGDHEAALEQMQLALSINPELPLALSFLADDAAERGDLDEAIRLWRQSLATAPHQPAVTARLELTDAALGNYAEGRARSLFLSVRGAPPDKAIETLKELLLLDRRNPETRRRLATVYLLNYDPENAEKVLLENEAFHPADLETQYLLGRTYVAMRRFDDALTFFGKVWSRDPAYRDTLAFLGELNALQRRYRNAIGYLKEALRKEPDDPVVLFKVGLYSLKAGQQFNALTYLRQARSHNPPESIREELHGLLQDY